MDDLYALVYTLFLDNDKFLSILRVCLIVFFMSPFLDKIMTRFLGVVDCLLRKSDCCLLSTRIMIFCLTFRQIFEKDPTTVLPQLLTWSLLGVTDYYPFNSYNVWQIFEIFLQKFDFVILVIIWGPHFLEFGTTMQAKWDVKYMCFCDFLNKMWTICTR